MLLSTRSECHYSFDEGHFVLVASSFANPYVSTQEGKFAIVVLACVTAHEGG